MFLGRSRYSAITIDTMLREHEIIIRQTKLLGRNEFAFEAPSGQPLGTARQTKLNMKDMLGRASRQVDVFDANGAHLLSIEDPLDFIRDSYTVRLINPAMELARLTSRFKLMGSKFDLDIAGFPETQVEGKVFNRNYTLTSQGRPIARVDAEFKGFGRAFFGKSDYRVRFEPGLDERQHAAILGVVVAIDMWRVKRRQQSS